MNEHLYRKLSKPLLSLAGDKKEWIIIPDGLFFLLPIESLPVDLDGKRMIEGHIVSYEFSARFIAENKPDLADAQTGKRILSFAPFSQRGADVHSEGMGWLEKLSFSADEISGSEGKQLYGSAGNEGNVLKKFKQVPGRSFSHTWQ